MEHLLFHFVLSNDSVRLFWLRQKLFFENAFIGESDLWETLVYFKLVF